MSDTEQSMITKEHTKNPKRVAAGKRLAFLRAEKRRMAEEKAAEPEEEEACGSDLKVASVATFAALVVVSFCAYRCFLSKPDHKHQPEQQAQKYEEAPKTADKGDLFTFE